MSSYLSRINWVDIFILILLIRTSYIGFTQGLSYEVLTLVGVIGAIILTIHNYEYLGIFLNEKLNLPIDFSNLMSFLILAAGMIFLFRLFRNTVYRFLKFEIFPRLERFGGLILGFVRGCLIASLIFLGLLLVPNNYIITSIKEKSLTGPMFLKIAPVSYDYTINLFPRYKDTERNKLIQELLKEEPSEKKVESHIKRRTKK